MIRKTIAMPDAMGDWIAKRIANGQFNNESEYFRDLIRKDQSEQERTAYLRARLEQGRQQIARGDDTSYKTADDIRQLFDDIDKEPLS